MRTLKEIEKAIQEGNALRKDRWNVEKVDEEGTVYYGKFQYEVVEVGGDDYLVEFNLSPACGLKSAVLMIPLDIE